MSLKGTVCPQKHVVGILPITADKAAYERGAALCSAVTEEAAIFAPKAPPRGREGICISLCSDQCEYQPMFLCSKHRVVHVKEVNVPQGSQNL